MLRIEEGSRAFMRVECRQASAAARAHSKTHKKKAAMLFASRPSGLHGIS